MHPLPCENEYFGAVKSSTVLTVSSLRVSEHGDKVRTLNAQIVLCLCLQSDQFVPVKLRLSTAEVLFRRSRRVRVKYSHYG